MSEESLFRTSKLNIDPQLSKSVDVDIRMHIDSNEIELRLQKPNANVSGQLLFHQECQNISVEKG